MIYPQRLKHLNDSMNEKGRWLEAIGEIGAHYLVLLRNDASGVTSHVHAVLQKDYVIVEAPKKKEKRDETDFF